MIKEKTQSVEQFEKQNQKPNGTNLIAFDDDDDELEQFQSDSKYTSQIYKEGSVISDQTQKRKHQIREKIKQYLKDRKSLGNKNPKKMVYDDEELLDGALIDELGSIQGVEKFHSEQEKFILAFNKKPDNAINDYIAKGIIKDSPQAIASYLIKIEAIDKGTLGDYFGKNDQKVLKILHAYCKLLKFHQVQFDLALRQLLGRFRLPGEAQQIERIIWEFALAFYQANTDYYNNADELFPLAYAIIMLATDAHNPKQENKMTKDAFIKNTQRPCPSISAEYLSGVYDRITKQRLQTEVNYMETLYARLKDVSSFDITGVLNLTKNLIQGDVFLKVCKNTNKFVQRKISLSQDENRIQWINDPPKGDDEIPRFIMIHDIIDLTLGLGSAVMKKNKVPEEFDSLCFTIQTIHRTLDLKAKTNKQRAKWVNYIKAILIRRREQRKEELQKYHEVHMSKDSIEDIWNTQIFANWDKHWDYKKKKPKEKNLIVRGMEALCCCISRKPGNNNEIGPQGTSSGLKIKTSLLDTLWKLGLPHNSRKTLWPLVIGNNLALTSTMLEQVKKRARKVEQFKKFRTFSQQVIQLAETVRQFRPDLPAIRDLLSIAQIFYKAIPNNPLPSLVNLIHMHHFISFYRGEKIEIESRIQLFQFLLQKNAPKVRDHFLGLKLETRMYLVSWFISIFADCFSQQEPFLLRIWDNFLLEGEIYLFKVGLAIVKYYEVQLKMCTFHEGLKLLRFPKNTSEVLFFEILNEEVDVKQEEYHEYVEKRKHAIIKTRVQAIPLE